MLVGSVTCRGASLLSGDEHYLSTQLLTSYISFSCSVGLLCVEITKTSDLFKPRLVVYVLLRKKNIDSTIDIFLILNIENCNQIKE